MTHCTHPLPPSLPSHVARQPHWSDQYKGRPWCEDQDCLWWFRLWSREHFGRECPDCFIDHARTVFSAARLLRDEPRVMDTFGYAPTQQPREGDAVSLTRGQAAHHIGMVVELGGRILILHALEHMGVVRSSMLDLRSMFWAITGYWRYVR